MELYHILNRGVDKRDVVIDDHDRVRFMHDLFVFNDEYATPHFNLGRRHADNTPRKPLVYIHAFCLMPNHYHLLLSPLIESGISLFMKKLNMGYSKYFNERYERSGALWQGKFKRILIERDAHFLYIPYYIHLNPLDLQFPEWRTGGVQDVTGAIEYLREYRWSSHLDYVGIKNFPSISYRNFLSPFIGSRSVYESRIADIITNPILSEPGSLLEK